MQGVAACLLEIASYRSSMGAEAFGQFPHGQLLVGYVRGVAAGAGMPLDAFLAAVESSGYGPGNAMWACLS